MNIDYSEIITKANARKDALQALSKELEPLESHAGVLFDVLDYFVGLHVLVASVDAEGQAMLGNLVGRINSVSNACNQLGNTLRPQYDATPANLPVLVKALRKDVA